MTRAYLTSLLYSDVEQRRLASSRIGDRPSIASPAEGAAGLDRLDCLLRQTFLEAAPREIFNLEGDVIDSDRTAIILCRIMEHRRRHPDLAAYLIDPLSPSGQVIDGIDDRLAHALGNLLEHYTGLNVDAVIAAACADSSEAVRLPALKAAAGFVHLPIVLEALEEVAAEAHPQCQILALNALALHADLSEVASSLVRFFASEYCDVALRAFHILESSTCYLGEYHRMIRMALESESALTDAARDCFSDDEIEVYLRLMLDSIADGGMFEHFDVDLLFSTTHQLSWHEINEGFVRRLRVLREAPIDPLELIRTFQALRDWGHLLHDDFWEEAAQAVAMSGDSELEIYFESQVKALSNGRQRL